MITDLCGKPPLTRSKLLKKTKKIICIKTWTQPYSN